MSIAELDYTTQVKRGQEGSRVKATQEWLTLHGFNVIPDGDFGPATEAAVRQFQKKRKIAPTGVVDRGTWNGLVHPARKALAPIEPKTASLAALTLQYARQHLRHRPREIGGQNRGPWVRLYMDGNEGGDWPWCAGFATFCVRQAAETLGEAMPIARTYSCDEIARYAKDRERFLPEGSLSSVKSGYLFLVRKTATDWTHVGIVSAQAGDGVFVTVEGNTNDDGNREGYEVCSLRRSEARGAYDFVRI